MCGGPPGLAVAPDLAELGQQRPRTKDRRRDPTTDVAHHNGVAKLETEHMARVDTRVDAADNPKGLVRGEWETGEGTASGEPGVALGQFVGADGHDKERNRRRSASRAVRRAQRCCRSSPGSMQTRRARWSWLTTACRSSRA